MWPVELEMPGEISRALAERVRRLRLERAWTQEETAARAGIALATYKRFERTGQISLVRLLKLAVILDAQAGFERLFEPPPARTLDELEQRDARALRKRGRRREG
jgi:transcriptional regulator with XRE-family HTH domain